MTPVVLAGVVAGVSLVVLTLQNRWHERTLPIVLRVVPAALLFLALPAGISGLRIIRELGELSASGSAEAAIGPLLTSVCTPMWWGAAGLLSTIVVAAALERTAARRPATLEETHPDGAARTASTGVSRWFGLLTPAAAVPTIGIALLVIDVSSMVIDAKLALAPEAATAATEVAGMSVSDVAAWISVRLVLVGGIGLPFSAALALLALVQVLPVRPGRVSVAVARYGWALAGAIAAVAAWLLFRFATLLARIDAMG